MNKHPFKVGLCVSKYKILACLKEIQKKTGNKFTLEEIQREYELTGKNEKTTLINLLKQKGKNQNVGLEFYSDNIRGGRGINEEKFIQENGRSK